LPILIKPNTTTTTLLCSMWKVLIGSKRKYDRFLFIVSLMINVN